MSYIGNEPTSVAFLTDTFSGNGSTTAFTLSAAPAGTSSILVAITGVVQDPSTYSVVGTTLTFSPAPPTGTGNISVRFLGIPASGVTTTAYRTVTEFTATAGQTTFSVPSYTVGFIDVYRNGVMLGSADYTASNGLTVVLASGATAGDLVEVISFSVSSVLNAIPASPSSVGTTNLVDGSVTTAKIANSSVTMAKLDTQAQYTGFKNRIINGDMTIDQRNSGASVSFNAGNFPVDRMRLSTNGGSATASAQQNLNSLTPPTGFTNYIGVSVTSGAAATSDQSYRITQRIEGFNVADLGFGTAGASTVTLSFWVRASIAGTYGGSLQNSAGNRFYVFSYTINTANTWEYKTATIPGDVTGTWLTTNGMGIMLLLSIGTGATLQGAAGSWGSTPADTVTGQTNLIGTTGATFYLTGVQLEKGSVATSFDYLPYTTELMLCQRYYEVVFSDNAGETGFSAAWNGSQRWIWHMKVQKRASATFALVGNGNWQVVTPSVNGGISSVGAYHVNTAYYLQSTANTIAGSASAEL
jgi:hypothetical protein